MIEGKLFSQDFLTQGITETAVWQQISEQELGAFQASLISIFQPFTAASVLNEANTESDIIEKVLDLLDWHDLRLKQVTASRTGRSDVPDYLLFSSTDHKQKAQSETKEDRRYRHGLVVLEAKKWMRPLDRGDATDRLDPGTPSNQILRYLSTVEVASERAVRWGILTDGAVWRLYWQGARSRSEEFLEINLASLLGVAGVEQNSFAGDASHGLKLFYCMFQRAAFLPQPLDGQGRTFHEFAFNEARLYEEKVSQDLGARVFDSIFPQLADALAAGDPDANLKSADYLAELREATLILLYRLLFIFYAEDRNLLPVRDNRYDDYALRKIREDIAKRQDISDILSNSASRYWQHLKDLFQIISKGDASIGMPAYNGGLFEESRAPLLSRTNVADARFAPLLDDLSRRPDLQRANINYRDLSVQHLGGIYERLLEYSLVLEKGRIVARPASFARKTSGSYYTHEGLVKLIIKEAVGPQITERLASFRNQLTDWKNRKELKPEDWKLLEAKDPAVAILDLKICDPAMGSGHFLVTLVDYLADEILEAIAMAEQEVAGMSWARAIASPHLSPLVARIKDIRERILTAAIKERWAVTEAQLDDRHIVRRMILKRVIYGVDKNPMAVELAKVALWLHTFTVGAPLSFLDHHLRCGDSLFGGKVSQVRAVLNQQGSLLYQDDLQRLDSARMLMDAIGNLTDIDIAEAHHSKAMMDQAEHGLAPIKRTLDFLQAKLWANKDEQKAYNKAWADLLANEYGDTLLESVKFFAERKGKLPTESERLTHETVKSAIVKADTERFLHWEIAFPTVFQEGKNASGFDAIIGNPPWDVMKLQEIEWFAERRPEISRATNASDRKKLITALQNNNDPLWQEYLAAQESAEIASKVARSNGEYPLLSGGDVNLYKLFVERAAAMIKPYGLVGLLTPSGIAADKGASDFFRTLSETGRLAALYDFENKRVFFPDVDSRFKFCALVFGGTERKFANASCAFYLHQLEELDDPERILTLKAEDFSAVNPNTGAAPIFRNRRDAEITTSIYLRQPVLLDKRKMIESLKVWPVRYFTMFHMANDSSLFKRSDTLNKDGWYPIGNKHWKKGEAAAVPLYEGKMIQIYDHRAAHIIVNPENAFRPAQQQPTRIAEHLDSNFLAEPQYWVDAAEIPASMPSIGCIALRDVTSPTNMRTVIATWIPFAGAGHKLPLLLPEEGVTKEEYAKFAPLLLANLNSYIFDFFARQKLHGQNLMLYILEQLPLIRPEQFESSSGRQTIADFIRGEVLRLSYTAHDLAPFARDMGYVVDGKVGAPFVWDETDRRHRLARLDALFFNLYGINRDDAAYILDQFPIVREHDEKAHGRYLTKDLILAYMNAVAAGDFTTIVKV